MVEMKSEAEIAHMREAGLVVARTLRTVSAAVAPGVTTGELDEIAEESIRAAGAVPSFLGYQGFPACICTSVNDEVVHGIPSTERVLRDGDVVSIDCGAIIDGWHGDAAVTVAVGEVSGELQTLMETTETSLWRGLAVARPGGRLVDIGRAVEDTVRAAGTYGIPREYGGHGIGTAMHQEPFVANYATRRGGASRRLEPGLVLAVEPMVTLGTHRSRVLDDEWTVVTRDGSYAAHFEHTVAVTERGPWVLTAFDGGRQLLGDAYGGPAEADAGNDVDNATAGASPGLAGDDVR
ncbi:MAG: type I methionyl aminopeptidase [Streptosporangiales bacterium]|nr:type I methionyl aminopeptidase [Streptosporangiales bacterium]